MDGEDQSNLVSMQQSNINYYYILLSLFSLNFLAMLFGQNMNSRVRKASLFRAFLD